MAEAIDFPVSRHAAKMFHEKKILNFHKTTCDCAVTIE